MNVVFPQPEGPITVLANHATALIGEHGDVDVEQSLIFAVKRIQVLDCNSDAHRYR